MNKKDILKIEVLETSKAFDQRESGITHTPYETELAFYNCIKAGDRTKAEFMISELLSKSVVAGRLSSDSLRQMKYWAVCCITLATRYAIEGGLDEMTAYNYSDESIMKIDSMNNEEEIMMFLRRLCLEITGQVSLCKNKNDYPYIVRKCINYINENLHGKITAKDLASLCSLSSDYVCLLFRKSVGMSVRDYVKKQRLIVAKDMLSEHKSISEIAYYLGFCSESYFIKCFKAEFGITPRKYSEH